ncbi:hypothetical protein OGAPHI_002219 [Ogataea philodendri]|uniref:Uncharacterized protein n=1 Tax=Ogataea philodendri TaxID=1378263 RepID=A0A9P8T7R9_9ASCO|nr:uncharacterized protein OGAPHI_002219 [Ogataea philodendri]KAH3668465.1 hypothetical protein OGAPHI_002219 [Ogataea philodendri]
MSEMDKKPFGYRQTSYRNCPQSPHRSCFYNTLDFATTVGICNQACTTVDTPGSLTLETVGTATLDDKCSSQGNLGPMSTPYCPIPHWLQL